MVTAHIKDAECNCAFEYNESKNSGFDDMQWNYDYSCKNKDHLRYYIRIELGKSAQQALKR